MKIENLKLKIVLIGIFLLAAFFRLYGVNWDQGQHLHPDERFLTMVANGISWPKNFGEYLDTAISPLNPHNRGFGFFVYGTFPVFFTKWVAESLGQGDYGNLTLIGRQLSALFDLGTVLLVFLIAKTIKTPPRWPEGTPRMVEESRKSKKNRLLDNWVIGLLAAFLYSIMVLPIQLSHFYAVETYLTFFLTLSFYMLLKLIGNCPAADGIPLRREKLEIGNYAILLGIAFGLALASKISAVLFLPIIGLGLLLNLLKKRKFFSFIVHCSLFIVTLFLTFRFAQPYAFATSNIFDITLNPKLLDNWKQLKSFDDTSGGFPPAVQWITTKSYLFPLKNMVLWGLGLPSGIIAMLAVIYHLSLFFSYLFKRQLSLIFNSKFLILNLSLLWILILFIYQGGQFVKALRYFFPIYPFLAILSGYFIIQLFNKLKIGLFGYLLIGLLLIVYPLSFMSIYSHPHSRVEASTWVYENIPAGKILSGEHWDDFIPMSLPTPGFVHEKYQSTEFHLYYPDNPEKWKEMVDNLSRVDYIIMSSNRLYGSIMTVRSKYPITAKYYKALFDGSLGFEKVAEFTSRPNIPIPGIKLCLTPPFVRYGIVARKSQECNEWGISFVDDYADETFTVYDHPKVIIFKKVKQVDYQKVLTP